MGNHIQAREHKICFSFDPATARRGLPPQGEPLRWTHRVKRGEFLSFFCTKVAQFFRHCWAKRADTPLVQGLGRPASTITWKLCCLI